MRFDLRKALAPWLLTAAALLGASAAVHADDARSINWRDLVPPVQIPDPTAGLAPAKLERLRAARTQQDLQALLKARQLEATSLPPDTQRLLKENFADVRPLLDQIKQYERQRQLLSETPVRELDGQRVRLPGFLLPLDTAGGKVREFLLVPVVGACVHVPPPPPNQIVHVRTDAGYAVNAMFDPVWVVGRMSVSSGSHDLTLVDGSAGVQTGYAMRAEKIEPYKQ